MAWFWSVQPSIAAIESVRSVPAVSSARVGTWPVSVTLLSHRTRVTPRRENFFTCKVCCPIPGRQPVTRVGVAPSLDDVSGNRPIPVLGGRPRGASAVRERARSAGDGDLESLHADHDTVANAQLCWR